MLNLFDKCKICNKRSFHAISKEILVNTKPYPTIGFVCYKCNSCYSIVNNDIVNIQYAINNDILFSDKRYNITCLFINIVNKYIDYNKYPLYFDSFFKYHMTWHLGSTSLDARYNCKIYNYKEILSKEDANKYIIKSKKFLNIQ